MDLFWSKTKNWALHNFNNSLIWNNEIITWCSGQWKKLNFDSQFSSVLLTNWKKVLIFLVIPFDFFSIMISSASHEWIKMLKYADILLLCSSRMQTKGCWKASQISWQHGLRPPGDLGNIQCERKHVTHEQLEIDFGCQWSPTRVSSSSK